MKTVLIIGGTGTISLPITKALAADSETRLTLLNRGSHTELIPAGVEVLTGDIHQEAETAKLLGDHHFDSVISFLVYRPEDAEEMIRLFHGKIGQFIFISTNVVLNHELTCRINEKVPVGNAYSAYGRGKQHCEEIFHAAADFPVTVVRPAQTYDRDRIPLSVKGRTCWSVIARILADQPVIVHGDGESVWAGTCSEDFAQFFLPLVGLSSAVGQTYSIINPEPYTWNMIYREIGRQLGHPVKVVHIPTDWLAGSAAYEFAESIRGDKYYSNLYDISAIRAAAPQAEFHVSMAEGVSRYLAYMNAHPELQKRDDAFDAWCDETIALFENCQNAFCGGLH